MLVQTKLLVNGINVRRDLDTSSLIDSIRERGIQVPLLAYKMGKQWVVKEGHRRLACALALELPQVPVTEVEAPANSAEEIYDQVVLNTTQRPLSYTDLANAYQALKDAGWTQVKIARKFSVSEPEVSLALKSLQASPKLQAALNEGKLSPSAIEPLLPLPVDLQEELADTAVRAKTVRKVTELVNTKKAELGLGRGSRKAKQVEIPEDVDPLEEMVISTLEEAAATLQVAETTPINHPVLRQKCRLKVKEILAIAKRLNEALEEELEEVPA